ncbi:hypothetical protein OnM2_009022 [Erysiphe neolycopersici]|uniref:Uncharacterized protein n=1 Tax=Erysiphe neolycopersici TaxID=212602 RepID=A0A420I6V4_9PEZI|nr:hypothetical protein OnM2_009022 [Erysiphe neolycopersici]
MSSQAAPISLTTFREALKNLTIQSLHMKADELRNGIAHLNYSNQQLKLFAQGMQPENGGEDCGNDQECLDAIQENEVVIARFQDRINLLAAEMKERGLGFQVTTSTISSSSPKKENHRILSVLANTDSFETRINGHSEDWNLVTGLPSTVKERILINPINHYGVDSTEPMTNDPSNTGIQRENETSQETSAEIVKSDDGVYL